MTISDNGYISKFAVWVYWLQVLIGSMVTHLHLSIDDESLSALVPFATWVNSLHGSICCVVTFLH